MCTKFEVTFLRRPLCPKGDRPFSSTGKPPFVLWEFLLFLHDLQYESTVYDRSKGDATWQPSNRRMHA